MACEYPLLQNKLEMTKVMPVRGGKVSAKLEKVIFRAEPKEKELGEKVFH